jgi:hypothetical protein
MHFAAMDLADTIVEGNPSSSQNNVKVVIFLRHHLRDDLKVEYLTMKNSLIL